MIDLEAFRRDGYVLLSGAVRHDVLEPFIATIEERVDRIAQQRHEAGLCPERFDDLPFDRRLDALHGYTGSSDRDWDDLLFSAEFCDLLRSRDLLAPLRALLGDEVVYQGNGHLRPHLPRHLSRLPWHQDAQFYGRGTEHLLWRMAQVWIPLVDAGLDSGCLAVVPGSHRWGLLDGAVPGTDNVRPSSANRQEQIYEHTARRVDHERVLLVPMRKGDLLMFTNLLVHTGTENRSGSIRWSIDLRFEATRGAHALTPDEDDGYRVMHNRIEGRGYVPLRVSGHDGGETWADWQRRAATGRVRK